MKIRPFCRIMKINYIPIDSYSYTGQSALFSYKSYIYLKILKINNSILRRNSKFF